MNYSELHTRYSLQAQWTRPLRQMLLDNLPQRPLRILEVGCGTGAVLKSISTEGHPIARLVGIDNDPCALGYIGNASVITCVEADSEELPFTDAAFDFVFCHFLLLWLNKPINTLIEMKRVCQPGGLCAALAEPDYAAEIAYPSAVKALADAQRTALVQKGINSQAGSKLKNWFVAAHFDNVSCDMYQTDMDQSALRTEIRQMQHDCHDYSFTYPLPKDAFFHVPTWFAYARV